MADASNDMPEEIKRLLRVKNVVLAAVSGSKSLSQQKLWESLEYTGALAAWALGEAEQAERQGLSPRDAYLRGVGYAVTAIITQMQRTANETYILDLLKKHTPAGAETDEPERLPATDDTDA